MTVIHKEFSTPWWLCDSYRTPIILEFNSWDRKWSPRNYAVDCIISKIKAVNCCHELAFLRVLSPIHIRKSLIKPLTIWSMQQVNSCAEDYVLYRNSNTSDSIYDRFGGGRGYASNYMLVISICISKLHYSHNFRLTPQSVKFS